MSFILHMDAKRLLTLSAVLVLSAALMLVASATSRAAVENGKIAFGSKVEGVSEDIFYMNSDGSDLMPLTNDQDHEYQEPVWSPDGTQVAFQSNLDGSNLDIYLMQADGIGVPVNITEDQNDENNYLEPTWSPDGKRIAFASENNRKGEIWIIDVESRSLLYSPAIDENKYREPAWSQDGQKIAFSSKDGRNNSNIYVMPDEGSERPDLLTRDQAGAVSKEPTWSPDGTKIAFQSNPDPDNEKSNIYVMPAEGSSNPTSLTNDPANSYQDPEWSPDGTKIALSARLDGDSDADIYAMKSDGSTSPVKLKEIEGSAESAPSWQRVIVPDEDDSDDGPSAPPGSSPSAPPLAGPVSIESVLFKLTSPKLKRSKVKRVKRAAFYRYVKRGFKGKVSGYKSVRASLVRVVKRRVKAKSKRKAKRIKRCYTLTRKRTSCGKTSRRGISIKAASTGSTFKYLPTGKSKRRLKRLKKGKRIRRGLYRLTFKAQPKAGGRAKTFRYRLKVR